MFHQTFNPIAKSLQRHVNPAKLINQPAHSPITSTLRQISTIITPPPRLHTFTNTSLINRPGHRNHNSIAPKFSSLHSSSSNSSLSRSSSNIILNTIAPNIARLSPLLTLLCPMGYARDSLNHMIEQGGLPTYKQTKFRKNESHFVWDLGDRFAEMPQHLSQELDARGYFAQDIWDRHQGEAGFQDPHIGYLMVERTIPLEVAANYVDPFASEKTRTPADPDYNMYKDEFTARLSEMAWMSSPILFEMVLATRRKPLRRMDSEHQANVIHHAPFAAINPGIDKFGEYAYFPPPPNGPAKPPRPKLASPYPWIPPLDFNKIHFQL